MGLTRWFGVEATGGKRFQFCLIELFPVANVPGARDYGRDPVIAMGVRRNLCVGGHAQHDRVDARLVRITFEHHGLNSANPGTASAGITLLRELLLGWRKTLFVEGACDGVRGGCRRDLRRPGEVTNKGRG